MIKKIKFLSILLIITFISVFLLQQCSLPDIQDVTPPVVAIIFPADGSAVSGTSKIVASATDNKEVKEIKVYVDGSVVASAQSNGIRYDWDTTPIADNRDHYIMAVARDKDDNLGFSPLIAVRVVAGVTPDTVAPVINILNPVGGQTVSGTVPVITQVNDDSEIDRVEFYVDGVLAFSDSSEPFEYAWDVSGYVDGSVHTLFAKAIDANGFSSVSPVISVTVATDNVNDIVPPTLTIIYPPAGAVFTGVNSITAVADAYDDNGIRKVEFYVDGILKSTDTTTPYQYLWPLVDYADSQLHTLYVKAYDNSDNVSAAMVVVTINP